MTDVCDTAAAAAGSVVEEALAHLRLVGARRLDLLAQAGLGRWSALLSAAPPPGFSAALWSQVQASAAACREALDGGDVRGLCRQLRPFDHWRLLYEWFGEASFFDVETEGLGAGVGITVIVCLHRGQLHRFTRAEGLDGFLELLDDVRLLVSFNGCGFDIPHVLRWFHIPELPCAHIDLRWVCYHEGWRGGLKRIERELGVARPDDLAGVDGTQAVQLWQLWATRGDETALRLLTRYCSADVVALRLVAERVLALRGYPVPGVDIARTWGLVPAEPEGAPTVAELLANAGEAAPADVRQAAEEEGLARRRRMAEQWRRLRRNPS